MLTMTDCSDADNRVQARYELDAAVADSGYTKMAAWAMKWARPLLEYADAAPSEDDVASELAGIEAQINEVEHQRDGYKDAIDEAIIELDKIDVDDAREAINAIITKLEQYL